jgi:hypothetical protein
MQFGEYHLLDVLEAGQEVPFSLGSLGGGGFNLLRVLLQSSEDLAQLGLDLVDLLVSLVDFGEVLLLKLLQGDC